jgi:hypothetical protein
LLLAGVECIEARPVTARARLGEAAELLRDCGLAGYEHAARLWLGRLTPGEGGRLIEQGALTWFAAQGVRDAKRFASMLAPGFE